MVLGTWGFGFGLFWFFVWSCTLRGVVVRIVVRVVVPTTIAYPIPDTDEESGSFSKTFWVALACQEDEQEQAYNRRDGNYDYAVFSE